MTPAVDLAAPSDDGPGAAHPLDPALLLDPLHLLDPAQLLDPGPVLRALPAQLRAAVGADLAVVGAREREDAVVLRHLAGARGDALAGLEVVAGRGVGGRALALGTPVRVDDYACDGSITHDYDLPVGVEGLRGVVAVPLVVAARVLAVAYVAWRGPAPAGDVALERLLAVGRGAAVRLHVAGVAAAQRELALAEQRRQLAGALHDAVGGPLFGVAARVADLLAGPAPDPALRLLDAEVRQASAALRAVLDELSLPGPAGELAVEVAADCRALAARSGLAAQAVCAPGLPDLPPAATAALVAAGREALRNAERHARARAVVVTVAAVAGGVLLVVTDDGVGPGARPATGGGLGLRAARDRLERLGGRLEVVDAGPGTAVRAWVPAR